MSVLRRYRFLIIIFGLAAFVALWEPPGVNQKDYGGEQEDIDQILESYEKSKKTYEILLQRYPEGEELNGVLGIIYAKQGKLKEARNFFEQALASGVKTSEDNFYFYAITLVAMDAPEKEIEEAIANWKFHFPFSNRRDPSDKQAVKEFLRSSRTDRGQ